MRYLSFIPIPVLGVIILTLYSVVTPSIFYEPSWLLPITNTVFVTVVFFMVAYIAARNYTATGRIQTLLLGCGALAFGMGGIVAGFVRSVPGAGANLNVTLYNTAALIGALFHFIASLILLAGISPEVGARRKEFWLVFSYVGLFVFMALFAIATLGGSTPPFFVQGIGPTVLRQWVLGSADILFAFSFLIFMGFYLRNNEAFLYWYSSALALTSISLTAFLIQSAVGSPIGWAGRFSQYLGGIYFLIAVITAMHSAHARRISFNNVLTASLSPAEEKFTALAQNLPGMVYRVFIRENNRMEFFNKMLHQMTGHKVEELTSGEVCSIERLILNEDREAMVTAVKRAILDHQPFEVEYRLKNKGGQTRYFLERGRPIYGEDGDPLYIDGIILDISERKVAEETLRKLDHEKAVVLNATVEGMGLVDTTLRMVWANKVVGDRAGLPLEQLPGRYCYEIWAGRSNPCVGCPILRTFETGQFEEAEIPSSDGRIWIHRGYPVLNENGKIESAVATAVDITERKQTEEKLRQHAQILDQIHDAVISTDLDGYVATWNKGAERIFGYSAEEAAGKHISLIYPPDQHQFLQYKIIGPLKKKGRHESEVKAQRKSGEELYAHLSLSMLKNKEGVEIGMIGSSVDVTDRRKIEVELRRSSEQLEIRVRERTAELAKANEALRHLSSKLLSAQEGERKRIAGELHDTIGSCLAGIKFKVENALVQIGEPSSIATESLKTVIPVVQEGIEECRRMQTDLRPSILDDLGLSATLSWFCRRYETIYTGIKVNLERTFEESCIPNSLKIVIFRITQEGMNNIAKHSKADLVQLSLRDMEGRIELVIGDNGEGFDLESALDSQGTRRGLGLTSMRERVELSNGSFNIESVKGKGTVIRALWPFCVD
jgi:PAS domain S-box-containing protein